MKSQQPAKLFSAHVQTVSSGKARGEVRDFGAREGLWPSPPPLKVPLTGLILLGHKSEQGQLA